MNINYNKLTLKQLKEINKKSASAIASLKNRQKEEAISKATVIAKKAGVPVIPVAIHGSREILKRDAWFPRSGRVRLIVGEPIGREEIRRMDSQTLSDVVYERIATLLGWPAALPPRDSKVSDGPPDSEAQKANAPGEESRRGVTNLRES